LLTFLLPPATSRPPGSTPLATKVDKMRSVQLPSGRGLTSYSTYVFWCLRARQAALT